ncbi:sensor histidine kinase [Pseudofrankia inefficax]|uniref:sensor histidine kinase n=1 Tax=Pseudofrankia inefficax (strain DSM 45817 / CECT 9037 / DDB 130130 / EuI1c) TaxID=298654 RepID=UPI0003155EDD|nr:sensor histidine kinase [Pseudofrankia inefficax]
MGGAVFAVLNRHSQLTPTGDPTGSGYLWAHILGAVAFAVAGWLLATRRPTVLFGWIALAAALGHAAAAAGLGWAVFSVDHARHLGGTAIGLWAGSWGPTIEPLALVVTWACFPYGRLPSGRVTWVALAAAGLTAAAAVHGLLGPVTVPGSSAVFAGLRNPLAGDLLPGWDDGPLFAGGFILGSITMIVRWLRADGELRRVLRWLAVVNAAVILVVPLVLLLPAATVIGPLTTVFELLVVVAVVLSNQIYGIDLVLNRALVYTLLTLFVAGVYAGCVALISLLGVAVGDPWTVLAAVGAAFSLAPARQQVQRGVNRFLYGERDQPYTVVTRVAARLEAAGDVEQLLPSLLDAVTEALRLPAAAVDMRADDGTTRRITHGEPPPDTSVRFPLVHQGRDIGALVVGLRSGQHGLDPREARLLTDLARQVAVAASNVILTEALLRSRERIVSAAEEERRRLRRDLHDGLGPVLTGAANKIDAARNLTRKDPSRTITLLDHVRQDLSAALTDLRRLVYALRPPVLDELGLLGALREHLRHAPLPVTLSASEPFPALPAAVEIAAYRIVTEAVTNVTRHAQASACQVTITFVDHLTIEIADDGASARTWAPGVGLASMRERATALGGTWAAGPSPGGGRVRVELPLTLAGSAAPAGALAGSAS